MFIVLHRPSGRRARPWLAAAIVALAALLAALVGTAAALSGPVGLRDGAVSPRTGTPTTTIAFAVTFQERDGDAPAYVRVLVDGTAHDMAPPAGDPDFRAGARFRFSTTLPVGVHAIAFAAADAHGFVDRDPAGVVTIAGASTAGTGGGHDGDAAPGGGHAPADGGPSAGGPASGGSGGGPASGGSGGTEPTHPPAPTSAPPDAGGSTTGQQQGAGSSTGTTTGGDRTGRTDPSGAADHTTSPASGHGAAHGDPSTDHPTGPSTTPTPVAAAGPAGSDAAEHADGRTHGGWPPADAVIVVTDRAGDSFTAGATPSPGGRGGPEDDSLPAAFRSSGGLTPLERSIAAGLSTTATAVAAMAFLFGKRRRDGDPPEPDEVLAADAARMTAVPAATLVPPATTVDESQLPRWRRPSLLEARKADPLRTAGADTHQSFDHGGVGTLDGRERRRIRYRVVRLLDAPDELLSSEIGLLDEGDEVELLERSGGYWLVLCPDGGRGWLHRMTLGDVVEDSVGLPLDDDDLTPDLLSSYLEQHRGA